MNYNEAIKSIEDVLNSEYHYDESLGYQLTSDDFEWLEKAKEVLEKQIPKKPLIEKDKVMFGIVCGNCPVCHSAVYSTTNLYCHICGQSIDWSDTE